MATTPAFSSDAEAVKYWTDESRSEKIKYELDRVDAILAFRQSRADILVPHDGFWTAYRLRDLYEEQRQEVRAMTQRLHTGLLSASVA